MESLGRVSWRSRDRLGGDIGAGLLVELGRIGFGRLDVEAGMAWSGDAGAGWINKSGRTGLSSWNELIRKVKAG